MMKEKKESIKYLAHYNLQPYLENRYMALSACNKIEYIAKTISRISKSVKIISASNSMDKSYKSNIKKLDDNISIYFMHGFSRGGLIRNKLSTLFFYLNLFFYLLKDIKEEDILIVYHSRALMGMVKFFKKYRKCNVILEIEEIYGIVENNRKSIRKEMEYFKCADAYIFPSILLNKKINLQEKPFILIHGTYQNIVIKDKVKLNRLDNRIHCVYSGTFCSIKGGAKFAILAAEYLPENYHLHVIGFGNKKETDTIIKLIMETSKKCSCLISYDGCLSGEEYIQFLQGCDIGLSTHNAKANFNDTSFPSKILSYMSNGLSVVSSRIPVVETSAVGDNVIYYENQNPKEIAKAILSINVMDIDKGQSVINDLNDKFTNELVSFLRSFR